VSGTPATAGALQTSPDELRQARQWVTARFSAPRPPAPTEPGLEVLANHDAISLNARQGKPLRLAGQSYTNGIYCHAFSRIRVRLPRPGAQFTAFVGVDSNGQTSGGRGSVQFSVRAGETVLARTETLREGMPAHPLQVALNGAAEFILQVEETPDGIACDQAAWAEAQVVFADGSRLSLSALPVREAAVADLFAAAPPFSFQYDGRSSAELLPQWELRREVRPLDASREQHTLVWTDPATGLQVRCEAVAYRDFATVEWVLHFKNTGATNSPVLAQIQALDLSCARPAAGEFLLHHNVGSPSSGNDYQPLETRLLPGSQKRIAAAGGRPTDTDWSYFNLEIQPDQGLILSVGWPGQWAMDFNRDQGRGLQLRAGQELTRFKLLPGEEVRSPLVVAQFWQGDWIRGQNLWRRWMQAHSMPRPGGQLPPPQWVASSSRQYDEMINANETNQTFFINRYLEEGLKLDYWWMDAGWYEHHGGGWPRVGTWQVDSNRFPRGLRAVSDYAHQRNIKIVTWFEPERVTANTWLTQHHPEWILGGAQGGLLNLGHPEAWRWLVDTVDRMITEQGIDLYRQDFNMAPLGHWRANDAPDRQGITEIKHVTGYLAYWDELLRRHPRLLIDACASGGRRNDLETMRRAVPLWRSDYAYETTGHQCMTYGLSLWLPYHGTGTVAARNAGYYGSGRTPVEPYAFWSNGSQLSLGSGIDLRVRDLDYATLRKLVNLWREVAPNYYGDFYPLTTWSRDNTAWMAWQFDRPEQDAGLVQVFRRESSPYETARFKLRGLKPDTTYRLQAHYGGTVTRMRGGELMTNGLAVAIAEQPGVEILTYAENR
jgi:alpha-galactosidase